MGTGFQEVGLVLRGGGSGFLVGGGCFQWGRWFRGGDRDRGGFRWWLMEEDEEGRNNRSHIISYGINLRRYPL